MTLELNKIHHLDNRQGLTALPSKCANLIISDPPYFEIKGEFDFVWSSFDEYLEFIEGQARLYKHILADNGTLFIWGYSKHIAYIQVIFDRFFNLENSLVWRKIDSRQYQYYSPEIARRFNTHNERLLMYSNEVDQTGLERLMDEFIKPANPFKDVIKTARLKSGLSTIEVAEIGKFYGKVNHGGSVSNWENGDNIPTPEQWQKLSEIIPLGDYGDIKAEYLNIRNQYEELRKKYEQERRPFYNFSKLEEVLEFSQEGNKTKNFNHPTQKPEKLTASLIEICSRPDDLVVVPFAGSGTECAMAAKLGRKFIGFEIDEQYIEPASERIKNAVAHPKLFEIKHSEQVKLF